MSDDLDITGSTSSVATEDLARAAEQLNRLGAETRAIVAALRRSEWPVTPGIYPTGEAQREVEHAVQILDAVAARSEQLGRSLAVVGEVYGAGERAITGGMQFVQSQIAELLGAWYGPRLASSPAGILTSLVACSIKRSGGLDVMLGRIFAKGGVPEGPSFFRDNNPLFLNSTTVPLYRRAVQLLGPFTLGSDRGLVGFFAARGPFRYLFPPPQPYQVGAEGVVKGGRALGLFNETPARLAEAHQLPVTSAPQDYHDRLLRVPHEGLGQPGPQVMIERYSVPGEPDRFSVYVGGTVTFNPGTTQEPWDMTSNVINATEAESGSVASVRQAMAAAGIDSDSPVQFTGYSQGGGTVARLVASEDYNTQGVLTFGGPTGQIRLPEGIPTVLVEHADDPVPALGGEQGNLDAVLVRRDVFEDARPDKTVAAPAHHIEYYLKTAQIMDESSSPQLATTLRDLDSFTAGARLESSTDYRFERVLEKD